MAGINPYLWFRERGPDIWKGAIVHILMKSVFATAAILLLPAGASAFPTGSGPVQAAAVLNSSDIVQIGHKHRKARTYRHHRRHFRHRHSKRLRHNKGLGHHKRLARKRHIPRRHIHRDDRYYRQYGDYQDYGSYGFTFSFGLRN